MPSNKKKAKARSVDGAREALQALRKQGADDKSAVFVEVNAGTGSAFVAFAFLCNEALNCGRPLFVDLNHAALKPHRWRLHGLHVLQETGLFEAALARFVTAWDDEDPACAAYRALCAEFDIEQSRFMVFCNENYVLWTNWHLAFNPLAPLMADDSTQFACAVCLGEFSGLTGNGIYKCSHAFCAECSSGLRASTPACPICRAATRPTASGQLDVSAHLNRLAEALGTHKTDPS